MTYLEDEKVASFDEDVMLLQSLVVDGVSDDLIVDFVLARTGDGNAGCDELTSTRS
jgi:hypothetical protein